MVEVLYLLLPRWRISGENYAKLIPEKLTANLPINLAAQSDSLFRLINFASFKLYRIALLVGMPYLFRWITPQR